MDTTMRCRIFHEKPLNRTVEAAKVNNYVITQKEQYDPRTECAKVGIRICKGVCNLFL